MIKKSWTVFVVSNDNTKGSFKEFLISGTKLKYGLAGFVFLFLLLGLFAVDYFLTFSAHLHYRRHQAENQSLKSQLSQMHLKMKKLNIRLHQIEDFSHKVKVIAGLEHTPSSFLGMGPLSSASFPDLPATIDIKPNKNHSLHRAPTSTSSVHSEVVSPPASVDSIMVYMDRLDKKSQLIREDVIVLTERLYERRDIMSSTPSILPVKGWISSHFGYRQYPFTGAVSLHEGMDIAAFPGTPVYAPADGVVVFAGYRKGYGNVVVIDHGYELSTLYGHLSDIMVSRWQKTKRRQVIGTIGSTGNSSGPHLHYEVRISNVPVDPSNYILDTL
ncbi:MAG: M23 family metallopeptidase [Bdellovibrionales bacterium]|nr:M23 family metallopeptidase [Bdellovibrionales bacterium]